MTAELLAEGRPVRFVHPLVRSAVTPKQTAMELASWKTARPTAPNS